MFDKNIHKRINISLLIFIVLFLLIFFKIIYLQVFNYQKLSTLAGELWNRNLPVEGNRGEITDRNGITLATNTTTATLIIIPNQVKEKEKTAKLLSDILNSSYEDMLAHVSKRTSIERVHPEEIGRAHV